MGITISPFNPTRRKSIEEVELESRTILQSEYFSILLQDIQEILLILNSDRQVVYVNRDLFLELDIDSNGEYLGLRPGECLGCENPEKSQYGCGASENCTVCGLAAAVSKSEIDGLGKGECSIRLTSGRALTLEVSTRRFSLDGQPYVFCAVKDLSEAKRRQNFEDIFLHDLMNRASSISAIVQALGKFESEEALALIKKQNDRLIDEINSHRIISKAESRKLTINRQNCYTDDMVHEAVDTLIPNVDGAGSSIRMYLCGAGIKTDATLLRRVILNLIKNAIEASDSNEEVTVTTRIEGGYFYFSTANPAVMPRHVQLQVFQRSFSTKGDGRGYGTYSVKLLVEQYLGGTVTLRSNPGEGTVFTVALPLERD